MRTTLALDDELVAKAQAFTGLKEKSSLVREALKALIERESARRLARLGGSDPDAELPPRRAAESKSDTRRQLDLDRTFAHGRRSFSSLLNSRRVLSHPFVIGEVALGSMRQREIVLSDLSDLPKAEVADDIEVLGFIGHNLYGRGIGDVDVHLLASARLTPGATIWTLDRRLKTRSPLVSAWL